MSAIKIIEDSLKWAIEEGYEITSGGCIVKYEKCRTGWQHIVGIDALGAVMLKHGFLNKEAPIAKTPKEMYCMYPGWLKDCCDTIGEDTYWVWRFNKGFDLGIQLTITTTRIGCFDGFKREKQEKDKVSRLGYTLRKKYIKRKKKA